MSKNKEIEAPSPQLVSTFSPLSFPQDTSFSKKTYSTIYDIKDELLDPSKAKDTIFARYEGFCKSFDSLMFESTNIKSELLVVYPKKLGREYSKTSSFYAEDEEENPKEVVYEVLNGSAYFLLENKSDDKDIRLIKLGKNNKIIIPKKFYYVIINSSETETLVCISLMSKTTKLKKSLFRKDHGATLYYTDTGFIRNQNKESNYSLKEFEGNYTEDKILNNNKELYKDFLHSPEKYEFLKN